MGKNKTDLRIVKTKKKLSDALIELLEEQNYDDIKISDLCQRAGVSRATFYNNFNSTDDVMNYYFFLTEEKIKASFLSKLKQYNYSFRDAYRSLVHTLLLTITSDENHIVSILSKNSASQIYMALQTFDEECIDMLVEYYKDQIFGVSSGLVSSILAGAATGIIFYVFQHKNEMNGIEEVEEVILNATSSVFKDVNGKPILGKSF